MLFRLINSTRFLWIFKYLNNHSHTKLQKNRVPVYPSFNLFLTSWVIIVQYQNQEMNIDTIQFIVLYNFIIYSNSSTEINILNGHKPQSTTLIPFTIATHMLSSFHNTWTPLNWIHNFPKTYLSQYIFVHIKK